MPGPAFATVDVVDCALKAEASYGAGGSLSNTTDGFELWLAAKVASLLEMGYLEDGDMGFQMAGLGEAAHVPPSGVWVKPQLPFFFRGPGAAYSASVNSVLHRIALACGFDATVVTTPGSEKIDYTVTPYSATPTSLLGKFISRSEEITADGLFGNLTIEGRDGKPWLLTANLVGRRTGDPIARAFGTVTYPLQTVTIPLGCPAAIVFGSYTAAVLRSFRLDLGRTIENARPNLNVAGYHAGYQPGAWKTRISAVFEATSLVGSPFHTSAGLNVYKLREAATQIAFTAQQGTAQYNRLKIAAPRLQLVDYKPTMDAGVACWDTTWKPVPSLPTATDWLTLTTD